MPPKRLPEPERTERRLAAQRRYRARMLAADPDGARKSAAKATKRWRDQNPERAKASVKASRQKNRAKFNATRREWRIKNIERALFLEARARAKKRGVEFSIELDDIPPMGDACPLLGLPFVIGEGRHPQSPSLDRIEPSAGYVRGNVWIVGYRANLIKNDGTAEEHERIASAMRARHGQH